MCTTTDRIASVESRLIKLRPAFLGFLAKRLGNRAEAEDVLQEFCVRVLTRKDQLRDAERMDAWLYAVLRSALNDHFRKVGRRRRLNEAVAREMMTAEQFEECPESERSVCHCLPHLMSEIRPSDAALIQRVDLGGEDRFEVASSLNIRSGTLNVRLHRARAALRDSLLKHCGCCCEDGFGDCSCPPHGCSSSPKITILGDRRDNERSIHLGFVTKIIVKWRRATMSETKDHLRDARDTDQSGLEATLSTNRSAFLGFLMKRLGNRADAEDVLQEFCMRVLARKDQLRDADRMDAWLYAVLRSALNDHYRKSVRSNRLKDAIALEVETAVVADDPVEEMDVICKCVKGLVTELRPADAELIRRIDIHDDDRAMVAADLGLRPGALNVRLHRARAALGDALLAHCGPCCRHGFDDCSCPPPGCEHPVEETDCEDEDTAS